jgi:hypothetical protein
MIYALTQKRVKLCSLSKQGPVLNIARGDNAVGSTLVEHVSEER